MSEINKIEDAVEDIDYLNISNYKKFKDKGKEIEKKLIEISNILNDMADYADMAPQQMWKEYGLSIHPSIDWNEEVEKDMLDDWKLTIRGIAFLLREISGQGTDVFAVKFRELSKQIDELKEKLCEIKDKDSDEYKKIQELRETLFKERSNNNTSSEAYYEGCLNKFLDLLRLYWWDLK